MTRILSFLTAACVLLLACSDEIPLPQDDTPTRSAPADAVGDKRTDTACASRWQAPSDVHSARSVTHQGANRECAGRAQTGAVRLGQFIREHFNGEVDASVPGDGIQIYNCRSVRGGHSRSVHGDGRAVDVFIPTLRGGAADNEKGDRIANWLATNAAYIGIQYIIWDRTSFRGNRSPQDKCYTGSHPHNDHIHVELTWAAARAETPFFINHDEADVPPAPSTPTPARAPADASSEDTASTPNPPETPDTAADDAHAHGSGTAWLGEPCYRSEDCIRSNEVPASCVVPDGANSGFCTVSCDGLCPDKSGHSETFCATANMMGLGDVGLCMAKSSAQNAYCIAWPDFDAFEVRRFVERSAVSQRTAVVCAAAPSRPIAAEDTHENSGNHSCDDPNLPVSDHGRSCAGITNNEWRCACSERYQTTVSQVCRNGRWTNYELDPRDCSRCDGAYSSGCEPR